MSRVWVSKSRLSEPLATERDGLVINSEDSFRFGEKELELYRIDCDGEGGGEGGEIS